MTTPPGQDPQPGPARGGPARPAPRGADSGWPGGSPDGRGTGPGRGSTGSGRDDVDGRRGGGAAGADGRPRGPARGDSDPWTNIGTPERGKGWAGGDRGGAGQNRGAGGPGTPGAPGTQAVRGPGRRGPREPVPGGKSEGTRRTGWGYSGADDKSLSRDRTASPASGFAGVRRGPLLRWVGALPTRAALYILLGAAAIGVLGTLVTKNEPGFLLGLCIIVGSVVAAIGIRLRSVYLLIPLPALIFFVTCVVTGAVHDSGIDTSKSQTYLSFVQWIADVFFGMCAATILVVIISGGRWVFSRMLVSGQFAAPGNGGGGGGAGGSGRGPRSTPAPGQRADRGWRPSRDDAPRDPGDPWDDRDNPGSQRANRGQVDSRDPWGDRRQPPDGGQRPAAQPGDRGYPGTQPSPGQPGDRGYPGGQEPGGADRPGNRALPPGRNPRGQRDQWDDRGTQGANDQRFYRDRRYCGDPWSRRLTRCGA